MFEIDGAILQGVASSLCAATAPSSPKAFSPHRSLDPSRPICLLLESLHISRIGRVISLGDASLIRRVESPACAAVGHVRYRRGAMLRRAGKC